MDLPRQRATSALTRCVADAMVPLLDSTSVLLVQNCLGAWIRWLNVGTWASGEHVVQPTS